MRNTLTLKLIRHHDPCGLEEGSGKGYDLLLSNLGADYGDDTPITLRQIYESNGYDDTLWVLRCFDSDNDSKVRLFACDCADRVRHLMQDDRSTNAIDVSRNYAQGKATKQDLDAAWAAARDAAGAAAGAAARDAARDAARSAAGAAAWAAAGDAAGNAARAAARAAAWAPARAAAWAAARDAAWAARGTAAWAAAWAAARDAAWAARGTAARDAAVSEIQREQMEILFKHFEC